MRVFEIKDDVGWYIVGINNGIKNAYDENGLIGETSFAIDYLDRYLESYQDYREVSPVLYMLTVMRGYYVDQG